MSDRERPVTPGIRKRSAVPGNPGTRANRWRHVAFQPTSGHFPRIDEPLAPPADAQEPGARGSHGGRIGRRPPPGRFPPAVEPTPRRSRIDGRLSRGMPPELRGVSPSVQEDVRERVPNLARRAQRAHVVAIREDRTAANKHSVHGSGEPRTDRLHPTTQVLCARRLRNQMHVVHLDRVVDETEPTALAGSSEARLHFAHEPRDAQRRDVAPYAQGHVAGMSRGEGRPAAMGITADRPRLATRAGSAPAPARR